MKRDMELVRKILFALEEKESLSPNEMTMDGYDARNIAFHCMILEEANFIKGNMVQDTSGTEAWPARLTWQGCEFLQLCRNDDVWHKAKSFVASKSVQVSVAVLTEVLKLFMKDALGMGGATQHLPQ